MLEFVLNTAKMQSSKIFYASVASDGRGCTAAITKK